MTFVLGREGGPAAGPSVPLGSYRARDGSEGVGVHLDVNGPHAALVVGKRGYGKSYSLGVIAEGLAREPAIAPVVVDPMGAFGSLAAHGNSGPAPADGDPIATEIVETPTVSAAAIDPRSWCSLLDLSPESGAGSLVWRAAERTDSLDEMVSRVEAADAPGADVRAAVNHLRLARSWEVFDEDGLSATDLCGPEVTVVDVSGLRTAPANAVVRALAASLYRARVSQRVERLPWLLVDEAHAFFGGAAEPALERVLTRGRAPGVSLVLATQRPAALSDVAVSQADLVVAHRLTAESDLAALRRVRPSYLTGAFTDRLPERVGDVAILDDSTETVHAAAVRERDTPHDGDSPAAADVALDDRSSYEEGESAVSRSTEKGGSIRDR